MKSALSLIPGGAPSPQNVGADRCALVDVLCQPPLHRHVPVPHAIPHPHAEVCAIAVDVTDGLIVILQGSCILRTGEWRMRMGTDMQLSQAPPDTCFCPSPMLKKGFWTGDGSLSLWL